jgi:hypothetical protein
MEGQQRNHQETNNYQKDYGYSRDREERGYNQNYDQE